VSYADQKKYDYSQAGMVVQLYGGALYDSNIFCTQSRWLH